jgi:hypothetical protein
LGRRSVAAHFSVVAKANKATQLQPRNLQPLGPVTSRSMLGMMEEHNILIEATLLELTICYAELIP